MLGFTLTKMLSVCTTERPTFVSLPRAGVIIKRTFIDSFCHFFVMDIVNRMRVMTGSTTIDLEGLHHLYKDSSRLYRGRPEMLLLRMSNKRNVQLFRKGKIQILGPLSEETTEQMMIECLSKVRQLLPNFQLTPATTVNMVLRVTVPQTVTRKLSSSDSSIFYEPELFPAILLTNWAPAHIHIFHNGKALITGVKSLDEANLIYKDLLDFIHSLPSEK